MGRSLVVVRRIEGAILVIRGERVMLDAALAELYGVTTKALNQAVRRNRSRFPVDFMFQLTREESRGLRSQSVTSTGGRGGRRYAPYAFTEQGVAMLSTVLRSPWAIHVNIEIMRTFVRLRAFLAANVHLARRLQKLEKKTDARFKIVFNAIHGLMALPSEKPKRRIGFLASQAEPVKTKHPGA